MFVLNIYFRFSPLINVNEETEPENLLKVFTKRYFIYNQNVTEEREAVDIIVFFLFIRNTNTELLRQLTDHSVRIL